MENYHKNLKSQEHIEKLPLAIRKGSGVQGSPFSVDSFEPMNSKNCEPKASNHASNCASNHASNCASNHASNCASNHASNHEPKASNHASNHEPKASNHASNHEPKANNHASNCVSNHASNCASNHASNHVSKRNILLINPWIHDFAAYDFWIKPLGLLYVAAFLRKNRYNVHLIDCLNPAHPEMKYEKHIKHAKRKSWGDGKYPKETIEKPDPLKDISKRYSRYGITPRIFRKELLGIERPELIFVTSMMTYWYRGVFEVIRIVRETLGDTPIVLGGNYVTLCPSHASENSCADFTIAGEGERNIPDLLKDIFGNYPEFIPDFDDLDSYPRPAFDLMPTRDHISILTSKGCPYRCTYCASHLLNSSFRIRDPVNVVDEIEYWNNLLGVKNFSFYDDALLVDPETRAVPMLKEIIRRRLACTFHCPNGIHLREVTAETGKLMFRAGFKTIRFGLETSNIKRQIETGGKVTNEELKEAVAHLKEAGYRSSDIGIYILCGLPGQSASEVRESINLVGSYGAKPIIAEFSPIPGTPIWEKAVRSSKYDITGEPLFHNNSLLPCQGEQLTYEMYGELKTLARTFT